MQWQAGEAMMKAGFAGHVSCHQPVGSWSRCCRSPLLPLTKTWRIAWPGRLGRQVHDDALGRDRGFVRRHRLETTRLVATSRLARICNRVGKIALWQRAGLFRGGESDEAAGYTSEARGLPCERRFHGDAQDLGPVARRILKAARRPPGNGGP